MLQIENGIIYTFLKDFFNVPNSQSSAFNFTIVAKPLIVQLKTITL